MKEGLTDRLLTSLTSSTHYILVVIWRTNGVSEDIWDSNRADHEDTLRSVRRNL